MLISKVKFQPPNPTLISPRVPPKPTMTEKALQCKDCPQWYGGEDFGLGPCRLKRARAADRYITYGQHACDEG